LLEACQLKYFLGNKTLEVGDGFPYAMLKKETPRRHRNSRYARLDKCKQFIQ
jgi:hypothetical protein